MSTQIISAIFGFDPPREGELPTAYIIGSKYNERIVTSIVHEVHDYGDHGIAWYIVKAGDDVIAEMQERAVAEIVYAPEAAA